MNKEKKWLDSKNVSSKEKDIIKKMNQKEILEHFGKDLVFGTAGIREHMGLGSSMLNKYTIKMITYAWIKSLEKICPHVLDKPFIITHDTRNNGIAFSQSVARTISGMGYKVIMVHNNDPVPTPISSYAIIKKNLGGGACITASHNPPIYSGYKIFDENGKHLMLERTNAIQKELVKIDINTEIPENEINIKYLPEEFEDKYLQDIINSIPIKKEKKDIKIVFSPLHGASYKLAPKILRELGFEVHEEPLQSIPDGNFTYAKNPNPENFEAFDRMIKLGNKIDADVLLTSDPDGDRVGIAVKKDGEYQTINGHNIASLLTYYLLKETDKHKGIPKDAKIIKTVVTTDLVKIIALSFGVKTLDTLTGFKFIGDLAYKTNPKPLLATEESYGASVCLGKSYDKDSVQILPILADMVNNYKKENISLFQVIENIFKKFGNGFVHHYNDREVLEGENAKSNLLKLIESISQLKSFEDINVTRIEDFRNRALNLPKTNLIKVYFKLDTKECWYAVRPSGTEPLMRKYYCIFSSSENIAKSAVQKIEKTINQLRKNIENQN